jgi:hypothetical protein
MANIKIPLKYNADAFLLQTTRAINFSTVKELNNVNYGNLVVTAKNGYPFSAVLQAYLLDENNNLVDSLFMPGNNVIPKGVTDASNLVIAPTSQILYIPFDQTKLTNIKNSRFMKLKAKLVMPPNPPDVVIKDTYEIDIDIIVDVNYKVERK